MSRVLTFLLILCVLADQYCIISGSKDFRFFTKLVLVPLLIGMCLKSSQHKNNYFLFGLIMSLFGDLFLLFDWGFIPGLGSFLLAHIGYCLCFYQLKKPLFQWKIFLPIFIYLLSLLYFLFPFLNEMKIPVCIYGVIISTMLYLAFQTKNRILILGSLLSVISDSILSFRLFVIKGVFYDCLVMITYVMAQYFLVKGILNNLKSVSN